MRQLPVLILMSVATITIATITIAYAAPGTDANAEDRYVVVERGERVYSKAKRSSDRVVLDRARPFRVVGQRAGWIRVETLSDREIGRHCYPGIGLFQDEGLRMILFVRKESLAEVTTEVHSVRDASGQLRTYAIGVRVGDLPGLARGATGHFYQPRHECDALMVGATSAAAKPVLQRTWPLLWPDGSNAGSIHEHRACLDRARRRGRLRCCDFSLVDRPRTSGKKGRAHAEDHVRACVRNAAVEAMREPLLARLTLPPTLHLPEASIGLPDGEDPRTSLDAALEEVRRAGTGTGIGMRDPATESRRRSDVGTARISPPKRSRVPKSRIELGAISSGGDTTLAAPMVRRKIAGAYMSGLKRCHRDVLRLDREARGAVVLHLRVGESGRVTRIESKGFSTRLDRCIEKRARSWRFAVPKDEDGDPATVGFKLHMVLRPQR